MPPDLRVSYSWVQDYSEPRSDFSEHQEPTLTCGFFFYWSLAKISFSLLWCRYSYLWCTFDSWSIHAAALAGVTTQQIISTADWSSANVFKQFYFRDGQAQSSRASLISLLHQLQSHFLIRSLNLLKCNRWMAKHTQCVRAILDCTSWWPLVVSLPILYNTAQIWLLYFRK